MPIRGSRFSVSLASSWRWAAVRCTAIALGYNVTLGVIGGLSPLVATWLVSRTENDYSPAFMIMVAAAISFLAVTRFKETYKAPLETA
jgi:MFS transporter, MHS family, proline/betaine transporter